MGSISLQGEERVGPTLAARLYREQREAPRSPGERAVTLRPATNEPIDAMIENLSRTGFAMSTLADFGIGSVIGLSVGGAVRRRAKIVRRSGLAYGCEFLSPLSELEVNAALRAGSVVAAEFVPSAGQRNAADDTGRRSPRKLSPLARAYVVGGLIVSIWAMLILLVWRLF